MKLKMGVKGIAYEYLVKGAIAVIAIIVAAAILTGPLMSQAKKVFGLFEIGGRAETELEKAIKCAYYRCVDGCKSEKVRIIFGDGKTCYKEYCKDPLKIMGKEGETNKVCGEDGEQWPVEVEVEKEKISRSKIGELLTTGVNCIVFAEDLIGTSYDFTTGVNNWLIINKTLVEFYSVSGSCNLGRSFRFDNIDSAEVSGKIFLSSNQRNYWQVKLQAYPSYIYLKLNGSIVQKSLEKEKFYRIKLVGGDEEELGNYVIKVLSSSGSSSPVPYASLLLRNETYQMQRMLSSYDPDWYLPVNNNILHIKFDGIDGDKPILSFEFKSGLGLSEETFFLPEDKDFWTESERSLDYWIAYLKELRDESKVGSKSFYGEGGVEGLRFSFLNAIGKSLDLDKFTTLHFWFKSDESGSSLKAIFSAEDGTPWEVICDLGDYNSADGWKEYKINITSNCTWLTEKKPILVLLVQMDTGSGVMSGYIDNLYLEGKSAVIR